VDLAPGQRPEATNHFDTVCALYRSLIKNHVGIEKGKLGKQLKEREKK
jgi:hypothetical protein